MNVRGGQLTQSNLNPVFPGSAFTGPLLAGSIVRTGGLNLAGLGSQDQGALANVGYAKMVQVGRITQVAAPGFASPDLVIPAQSMILRITNNQLVAWNGAATTFNIGTASDPTHFGNGISGTNGSFLSFDGLVGGQVANWANVGNQDIQLIFTSANVGAGVGIAVVEYIQGINAPIS